MSKTIEEIRRELQGKTIERAMTIARDTTVDEASRTVNLAFASDKPCETWFGDLITSVNAKAIRTDRLENGLALLLDHDREKQIGIVEEFSFGTDGIARAKVRFSRSVCGEEIFQDVKDGVRRSVSVGFLVHEMHLEKQEEDKPDLYRSDDWEPIEISIVSIPADISVGVGRSLGQPTQVSAQVRANSTNGERKMPDENIQTPVAPAVEAINPPVIQRSVADKAKEIVAFAEIFGQADLARTMLAASDEVTLDDVRAAINEKRKASTEIPVQSAQELSENGNRRSPARVNERIDIVSIGEAFIRNLDYKATIGKSRLPGTRIGVEIPMMPSALQRATFDSAATGLTSYINYVHGPTLIPNEQLTVRDLLAVGQTNLAAIPYIQESSYTNAATTVAEEGQKPEATLALQDEVAPVKKIAVMKRVTDEMWNDYPTLRDYINNRLRFMVMEREEVQLLTGAGTGSEITGLLTASILSQAKGADTVADAIHKAITKVRINNRTEPDAIVINPLDWEPLRLAKDDNNQYYGGGPFGTLEGDRLWGKRVVITSNITENTALVGSFKIGAQIFDREGITVEATNSHDDDFEYNRMAIRVEERLALAIWQLNAFCKVTGI